MKKFIFISLLVITQYGLSGYIKAAAAGPQQIEEAAGPYASWNQAVQGIPNWQQRVNLYLSGNQIAAIPDGLELHELQGLYLYSNQIAAIPDNFNPPQLRRLSLRNNRLGALPANFNPPQLQILDLDGNMLVAIPDDLELHELRWLHLSNNNILVINPKRLLEQFPKLKRIDLSNNPQLYHENIQELRDRAREAGRGDSLTIIAENIRPEGDGIKGSEE